MSKTVAALKKAAQHFAAFMSIVDDGLSYYPHLFCDFCCGRYSARSQIGEQDLSAPTRKRFDQFNKFIPSQVPFWRLCRHGGCGTEDIRK